MRYGLTEKTIAKINTVFASHPAIEKAVLFGSRAKGNYRPGSDIDLTLYGDALASSDLDEIITELDDLLLPYRIDLSIFDAIDHAKLREHIERIGVVFYQRAEASANIGGAAVKTGWQTKQLADVCQIKPPKAEARQRISGKELVSFVPMEDLGIDQKILVPTQTRTLEDVAGSYTYFADGDVLLAKITPCFENGKLGIAEKLSNGIGFGSSEYIVFRPSPAVDKEWLYYFLSRESFRTEGAERMSGAVGHKRVSKEFIESYPIPVPPLPEQHRIVAILDEAFDGIATAKANAEKNLQNARALFESHLQSVFTERGEGWVEKKLGDVCAITSTLVDPRKDEFCELIHVGAGNIESQTGVFIELKTAHEEGLISGKFLFDESMVLYSKIRPYLMKVARPHFSGLCSADMYPLAPIPNKIFRDYLFHLLLSKPFTEYAIQGSARAGMPKVNREHLFEFRVWLPSVERQKELAGKLDVLHGETQRLESLYQQKLTALDDLKKSLLHQAFSGAL
jgi:type I restriction enzyme S subunit